MRTAKIGPDLRLRWLLMTVKLQEVLYEEKSLDNNNIICKSMLFLKV